MSGKNVTEVRLADAEGIAEAARILESGGLVAVPTETVYGLAARADSAEAVAKIYAAKGRPDFNPLIVVNYRERRTIQTSPTTTAIVGDRKTVFGVGFTPVGLQFNWRNSKKYQPFIAGGIGVALFNKKFPDNRSPLQPDKIGNRFQVMPEFGAGLEIRNSERKSYFIGYKYHHLSNAYTAPLNVGYNTNMVYGGMYFQRGR